MKRLLLCMAFACMPLHAAVDPLEGVWQVMTLSGATCHGNWSHSRKRFRLTSIRGRPAPGARSVSEVFMHIALTNFHLLSVTGPPMPLEIKSNEMEKTVNAKPEVIDWLKQSLDAVKTAHANIKPADLQRKVKIANRGATVDGMYLRIIVHANEHVGAASGVCTYQWDCAAVVRKCEVKRCKSKRKSDQ